MGQKKSCCFEVSQMQKNCISKKKSRVQTNVQNNKWKQQMQAYLCPFTSQETTWCRIKSSTSSKTCHNYNKPLIACISLSQKPSILALSELFAILKFFTIQQHRFSRSLSIIPIRVLQASLLSSQWSKL